jgi:tRNA-dihydrouridine synthase B
MPITIGNIKLQGRVYIPPMAGVTDLVFRRIVRSIDPNCLLSTEMVSSRALMHKPECRIMELDPNEHPIGIQLFGHEPECMADGAKIAEAKGADFVDINMGCPVPKITKGKDGCALMREPELAREIISVVKASVKIPVTVKFRLGWDDSSRNAVEFGQMAEAAGASAVTVHGRTRQQLYSGKADWEAIALVKKAVSIPVFGNGDIFDVSDAEAMLATTDCDGVAVARGTLGNPWLVSRISKFLSDGVLEDPPDDIERIIMAYRHCAALIEYKGERVGANESRRHLGHYTKGMRDSAPFRAQLSQVTSKTEVAQVLSQLAQSIGGMEGLRRFLVEVQDPHNHPKIEKSERRQDSVPERLMSPVG